MSLTFFLVQTSVVGGAGVRKGKSQPSRRLGARGLWVVQQSDQYMSLFEFQEPVPLSDGGVGDLGRWGAMMLTSKWCDELEGTRPTLVRRMGRTVSTCGFEVCPGLQEPQSPHSAVCAVPTSSGANRIAVLFWWLPIPLPWHSWGLSQCPDQEC